MSTNNHIDLVEFPASSPEEVKAVTTFFAEVFGWQVKEWGNEYSDTQDSGVAAGGKVTHDISAFPGGRRFASTDPAGNQLAAWGK